MQMGRPPSSVIGHGAGRECTSELGVLEPTGSGEKSAACTGGAPNRERDELTRAARKLTRPERRGALTNFLPSTRATNRTLASTGESEAAD